MLQKLPDSTSYRFHVLPRTKCGLYEAASTLLLGQAAVSHPLEDVQEFREIQIQACKGSKGRSAANLH